MGAKAGFEHAGGHGKSKARRGGHWPCCFFLELYCLGWHGCVMHTSGQEVLLECTSTVEALGRWSLSLDAARMSHPPDAHSHQQGRRAGGEREAMPHPTSRAGRPARAHLCHLLRASLAPPRSTSVSRGANLAFCLCPASEVALGSSCSILPAFSSLAPRATSRVALVHPSAGRGDGGGGYPICLFLAWMLVPRVWVKGPGCLGGRSSGRSWTWSCPWRHDKSLPRPL